jgi:hypothetical protein
LVAGSTRQKRPKLATVRQEAALADDEAEIVRLLEALNGTNPAEIFRRSVDNDAASWVARALRWGADLGLSPEVSTLILSETLREIRAASSHRTREAEAQRATD